MKLKLTHETLTQLTRHDGNQLLSGNSGPCHSVRYGNTACTVIPPLD